jgi:hypothetical protein
MQQFLLHNEFILNPRISTKLRFHRSATMSFLKRHSDSGERERLIQERDRLAAELIPELRRAICGDPSSAELHIVLAKVLFDLGRLDEAQAECQAGLNLDYLVPTGRNLMYAIEAQQQRKQIGL